MNIRKKRPLLKVRYNKRKMVSEANRPIDHSIPPSWPRAGLDTSEEGLLDDYQAAEEFAEEHGLSRDTPILSVFSQKQKADLLRMIKHGEFTPIESAILKAMMATGESGDPTEAFNLEELGAFIGAWSPRSKGKPVSKVAAQKELNRILDVVA